MTDFCVVNPYHPYGAGDPPNWNWWPSPPPTYPVFTSNVPRCPACGACHTDECKRKAKVIEYHDNGTIKRVEYEDE